MKTDWFTLAGIIIIFAIAVWSYMTIDSRVSDVVEECNEHWRIQTERACPMLFMDEWDGGFEYNLTGGE